MPTLRTAFALFLVTAVSACAVPGPPRGGIHQTGLDCPEDLARYCGGWVVYEDKDVADPQHHIKVSDEFVIGSRRGESDLLTLFPRARGDRKGLVTRWAGQRRVGLRAVGREAGTECLVGAVRLPSHESQGEPHDWHALTLRVETIESPEIGPEDSIKICIEPQAGDSPPRECAPVDCGIPDSMDPRNHGGRAHARD